MMFERPRGLVDSSERLTQAVRDWAGRCLCRCAHELPKDEFRNGRVLGSYEGIFGLKTNELTL